MEGRCNSKKPAALVLVPGGQGENLKSGTCYWGGSDKSLNTSEPHFLFCKIKNI